LLKKDRRELKMLKNEVKPIFCLLNIQVNALFIIYQAHNSHKRIIQVKGA